MLAASKVAATAVATMLALTTAAAQRGAAPPNAPASPKAAALFDITGYWVSLVTEDWRYRQFTPAKGDYVAVPVNPQGKKVADAWDPAKDEAAGETCKAYGAAGLMRIPTRLHITWQDDNTLKLETDTGTQTRSFPFGKAAAGAPTTPHQGDLRGCFEKKCWLSGLAGAGFRGVAGREPLAPVGAHLLDQRHERAALGGQPVLHARGHLGIGAALDDSLRLERAQAQRKRAWADALEGSLELTET